MFEQVIATLLNRVIGDYVQGLETTQLNVGIWAGDVQLRNLHLRQDALINLGLPIHIVKGCLGLFVLKIPWKNLKSEPIRILIDNVSLVASPRNSREIDPAVEAERLFKEKLKVLAAADARRFAVSVASSQQESYSSQLITKLIDNIQVAFKNISVQYLDSLSAPTRPFAVNFTLQELSVVSVNEDWQEKFIESPPGQTRKLLKLRGLTIQSDDTSHGHQAKERRPMLYPVHAEGRLTINRKFGPNVPQVDLSLDFDSFATSFRKAEYESICLTMHYFQTLAESLRFLHLRIPPTEPRTPKALWRYAIGAARMIAHEKVAPKTWQFLATRREIRLEYMALARTRVLGSAHIFATSGAANVQSSAEDIGTQMPGLTPDQIARISQLQKTISLTDLLLFEEWTLNELRKEARDKATPADTKTVETPDAELPESPENPSTSTNSTAVLPHSNENGSGWGSWWPFSYKSSNPELNPISQHDLTAQFAGSFPPDYASPAESLKSSLSALNIELDDLRRFLDLDDKSTSQSQQNLEENCLLLRFSCNLKKGSFHLERQLEEDMLEKAVCWSFGNLTSQVIMALDSSISFFTSMGTFTMVDTGPDPDSDQRMIYPSLVSGSNDTSSGLGEAPPLFATHIKHSADETVISLTTQPLVIICRRSFIDEFIQFFALPESVVVDFAEAVEAVRHSTKAGLQYALEMRRTVRIKMEIAAPVFLVPLPGINAPVLCVDTGRLLFTSRLPDSLAKSQLLGKADGDLSHIEMDDLLEMLVDVYDVQLTHSSIFLGKSIDACLHANHQVVDETAIEHIVKNLDILLTCKRSALPAGVISPIPALSILTILPSVDISLSNQSYSSLMAALAALFPPDNMQDAVVPVVIPEGISDFTMDSINSSSFQVMGLLNVQFQIHNFKIKLGLSPRTAGATSGRELAEIELGEFKFSLYDKSDGQRDMGIVLSTILVRDLQQKVPELQYLVQSDGSVGVGPSNTLGAVRVELNQRSEDSAITLTLNSIRATITRESMADLYQFALLTFMAQTVQTLPSESGQLPPPSKSQNRVIFQMHGVDVLLNDCSDGFANLHLGESSVNMVMEADTMSVNGSLGAFRVGMLATGESIAQTGDGPCTAKFRYDSNTPWALAEGFDAKAKFDCESLLVQYMPVEINRIIEFLSAFTAAMVDVARDQVIKTVDSSSFGWDVRIESPVIIYKKDGNELHGNLGSLSAHAVPCVDPHAGGAIGIEASLQDVSLFTRLNNESDQTILHEMHLLVSMKDRHVSINLSPVACTLTKEQWIFLSMIPQDIVPASETALPDDAQTRAAGEQQPDAPGSDLEVSFSCDAIQLNLRNVLFAELNSFFANVILGTEMTLEGGCSALLLNDLSTEGSQFHTILTSATVQPFGHAILFNGSREGSNIPLILTVAADMLKATVYPSFFLGVQKFFEVDSPAPPPPISESSLSSKKPAALDESVESIRLHIKLVGVEIYFIHQPLEFHSPALVLATQFVQVAWSSSPFVQVKGMSAHVRMMNSTQHESQILQDFTISLVPKLVDKATEICSRTFSLTISKLELRLSFRHVNLVLALQDLWSNAFGTAEPQPIASSDPASELPQQLVPNLTDSNTELVYCNETMHVSSDGMRILIVDDLDDDAHGPVIDCSVTIPKVLDINDWSSALQIKTTFDIRVKLWNPVFSLWEPLLEQCKLQVSVKAGNTFSLDVQTKQILEANLTKTLMRTVERVTTQWPSTVVLSRGTSHGTIKFYNATGHSIRVIPAKETDMDPIEISPDHEGQFPATGDLFEVAESALAQIRVSVLDPIFASTETILISRGIDQVVPLKCDLDHSSQAQYGLYFHVTSKTFSKHVRISSPYCVKNMTGLTLDMICGEQICEIKPKGDCFIALKYMGDATVRVRPSIANMYAWSSSISLKYDQQKPDSIISCKPSSSNKDGYKFTLVSHTALSHENVAGVVPLTVLKLHCPLTIENNLPEAIKFQVLSEQKDIPSATESLESEAVANLGILSLSSPLGIQVQIPKLHINLTSPAILTSLEDADEEPEDDQSVSFGASKIRFKIRGVIPNGFARTITIYTPFVLQNRLPLPVDIQCYKSKGFLHLNRDTISVCSDSKVALRVGGADISPYVNLDTIAGSSGIVLHSVDGTRFLHIGITLEIGNPGVSHLSRLATFNPRFVIHNASEWAIEWKQVNTSSSTPCDLMAQSPILWLHKALKNQIVCRPSHAAYEWSSPLELNEMGETFLRVNPQSNSENLHPILLSVMVSLNKSCIDIQVSVAQQWPFRIENLTSYPMKIAQSNQQNTYPVAPGQNIKYSWDDPTEKKALLLHVGAAEHKVNLFEIGSFPPFRVKINGRTRLLEYSVVLEDNVRVLRIRKYHPDRSLYRATSSEAPAANQPPPSSPISFELVNVPNATKFSVSLDLDLGISIVDENQELAYCSFRHLNVAFNGNDESRSIDFSIHWVQIDNQMLDASEDIALYPSDIIRGSNDRHVLQLSLSQSTTNQQFFKNFTVLLQEISVSIDRNFLASIINFVQSNEMSESLSSRPWSVRLQKVGPPPIPEKSTLLYFENFAIHPIQLNLTFTMGSSENSGLAHMPLGVLSASLANISNMPVPLDGLIVDNLVATSASLTNSLSSHFYDQAMQKIYSVLGSVDLLGNPVQLWGNISSGVKSFFIEPYLMSMERPQDIGFGIAKGGAALVGKTVYGFADGFARFSSSIGRGLAAATMDKRFQQSRARSRRRNRPKHGFSGVAVGVRSLGSNLVSAATGVIQQPIRGASEAGFSGFMKGVARAGLGLVVKPVLGIADAANSISEGIRNTTTVLDDSFYEIERVRLPRVLHKGCIKAFSEREALGQFWLQQIDGGKGRYVMHFETKQEDYIVIVSDLCIVLARLQSLHADWIVKWRNVQQLDQKLFAHSMGQEPLYFFRIVQTNGETNVVEATDPKALETFRTWLQRYIQGGLVM